MGESLSTEEAMCESESVEEPIETPVDEAPTEKLLDGALTKLAEEPAVSGEETSSEAGMSLRACRAGSETVIKIEVGLRGSGKVEGRKRAART